MWIFGLALAGVSAFQGDQNGDWYFGCLPLAAGGRARTLLATHALGRGRRLGWIRSCRAVALVLVASGLGYARGRLATAADYAAGASTHAEEARQDASG